MQEEYDAEGIDWSHIDFVDNQDCLETIDAKPPRGLGVMSVLDDQCNFPKSTDQSFSDTLRERIRTARFRYRPGPHKDFVIEHYAGPVTYDCTGFLDKNRDTISVDLVRALEASSAPVCASLLPYVQVRLPTYCPLHCVPVFACQSVRGCRGGLLRWVWSGGAGESRGQEQGDRLEPLP